MNSMVALICFAICILLTFIFSVLSDRYAFTGHLCTVFSILGIITAVLGVISFILMFCFGIFGG